MENKGLFIAFEGVDGCGKSSTMRLVADKLKELGHNVIVTREPGGTEIAEKIREIILHDDIFPETEALLFAAARTEHTGKKIKPFIEEGYIVLSDRYIGSSFAYQGYARKLGINNIRGINDFGIEGFRPDLQVFLDVTPEEGFKRMGARSKDRMESEPMEFYNDIYKCFKELPPVYQVSVDGMRNQEVIVDEIIQLILSKLEGNTFETE